MTRALVQLDVWALGVLMVVGLPLVTVVIRATVRRLAPSVVEGESGDFAG